MARKPLKLTKNALMLLGIIALLLITFLVLKFGGTKSEQPEKKITETLYILTENKSRTFCKNLRKLIVLFLIYGETDTIMVENGFLLEIDR